MSLLAIAMLAFLQATTMEGIVTKPSGVEPLPGARVTLRATNREISAITEEDGRFTFINIPPGDYTLVANSPRYGSVTFGQRRPGGPGSTISVAAGASVTGLKLSMFPTGTIAGRIMQRNGEPAVRASVQAFQYAYRDGKRTLVSVRSAMSNDLGEYRIFWLNPGQYVVAATLGNGLSTPAAYLTRDELQNVPFAPNLILIDSPAGGAVVRRLLDDGTFQEESYVPLFYPGTTEARDATPIEVSAGATMNGVNITIGPTPARKISGQVMAPSGVTSRVTIAETTGTGGFWRTTPGPSFEFKGLKSGSYLLFAEDGRNFGSEVIPIEVGDRDIDNIRIGLRPKMTLTGRVVFEGGAAQEPNPFAGLMMTLTQGNIELPMAVFQPNPATGAFVVNNVNAGNYQLLVRSTQQPSDTIPFSVKSVRLGQADASNGITITDGTQDRLEVVMTREFGSLDGLVTDPGRNGAPGATVVLVPAVARKNGSLYKSTVADVSGRFRFQGIVPGDYVVFAWSDVETGAWQSPEFLRPFEARGRRVQISTNSQDVQVPVISAP